MCIYFRASSSVRGMSRLAVRKELEPEVQPTVTYQGVCGDMRYKGVSDRHLFAESVRDY